MSTDAHPTEHRSEDGGAPPERGGVDDVDDTPRSEVPIAVKISTPSTAIEQAAKEAAAGKDDGYFSAHPAASEHESHVVISQDATPSPSASDGTVRQRPHVPESVSSADILDRPPMPTADSAATITPATSAPVLLRKPADSRPAFPDQSYAALQHQQYPRPNRFFPPPLKQRGSHPGQIGQIHSFTSAYASLHQSGSRTVGNSPVVTPGHGLFAVPQAQGALSAEWESVESPGTYSSPFLHFTQRVPPKETHIADVNIDEISGRKIINHYEIMDELGRGTHGKVKLGRDIDDGTYVAIKIVERFSKKRKLGRLGTTEDKVKKEVAILKQARHPNVVALLEVIDDPSRKKVYIVLEWVERGEIQWRVKGPKEIAIVEARRYDREKAGQQDPHREAEDAAILAQAQKRLARQRRRNQRTFRRARREAGEEAWSNEMMGDDFSDLSDDDKLSRISSESYNSMLRLNEVRRGSRAASPYPPQVLEATGSTPEPSGHYQSVTSEPQTLSPAEDVVTQNWRNIIDSELEGTMYGAYVPYSGEHSRVPSVRSSAAMSRSRGKASSDSLSHLATEVLDSELDSELEYVPVMTLQQCRIAFRDTLLGLQYLHHQGIVHRDIKPPNLLATKDQRVKISDFGVSYLGRPIYEGQQGEDVSEHEATDLVDETKELAKTVGTPAFYAPELCVTEPTDDVLPITKAIDVWALGVTLFCMLFARTPFVDDQFVVMRQIAEEEVYIPRTRLRPVEEKANRSRPPSRPTSQNRALPVLQSGRRHELDIEYEEIEDTLFDLLKRMLTKDPRKRITLEEVRHNAWVVADIQDKVEWLEETDPQRQKIGKKIEVSKEDVNQAVVPLLFNRVKSTIQKVGERMGLASKPASRSRAVSNTGGLSPTPSNGSSPSASQDGRRSSWRGDDSIITALKASKEGEHPLSKSLAASPELGPQLQTLDANDLSTIPPLEEFHGSSRVTPPRPALPERASTTMGPSGSMRTVRQSDFRHAGDEETPPPSPDHTGTPTTNETSWRSGGWAARMFKNVRERSKARTSEERTSSSDRGSVASLDQHVEPSLAVSPATAAGHMNSSVFSDEVGPTSTPSSTQISPAASRPLSAVSSPSGDRLFPIAGSVPRKGSRASVGSLGLRAVAHGGDSAKSPSKEEFGVSPTPPERAQHAIQDERVRKLVREADEDEERALSSVSASSQSLSTCPPSPDDNRPRAYDTSPPQPRRISDLNIGDPASATESSYETSPTGHTQLPAAMVSSTSDFGSAVSMSVSNPSMPSAQSEASSADLPAKATSPAEREETSDHMSSGETVAPAELQVHREDTPDEGYTADDQDDSAVDSGEDQYDSSSDSDGGLVMSRRKSLAKATSQISAAKERRLTGLSTRSKKSSRSGSNNTMKKIRTRDSEDERHQLAPDVPKS